MTVPTSTITAVGEYRYPTNKRRVFSNVTQHPVDQAYDFTNIDAKAGPCRIPVHVPELAGAILWTG